MDKLSELIPAWLRSLFTRGRYQPSPEEARMLRSLFKERYHSFRQLLAANSKALRAMAEMEQAALGSRPFGMPFVRSRCTAARVAVHRMVQHLSGLAPEKYDRLFSRLEEIEGNIQQVIGARPARPGDYLVAPLTTVDASHASRIGAKMANLGEAQVAVGAEIPDGFVISAAAFDIFLAHKDLDQEIARQIQATEVERTDELFALSSRLQQLIIGTETPPELARVIATAVRELSTVESGRLRLAVRSSALGEDTAAASFAGQYRSQLNVRPENLLAAYLDVAASKYTPQAMHYRLQRGLRDVDVAMAVGCLAMVDARVAGVTYTADPLDPEKHDVVVSATWGLPKTIVDGRFGNDTYVVRRGDPPTIVSRTVEEKNSIFVSDPDEGTAREELPPERANQPCLNDGEILEITHLALKLEEHFGVPQDIEWAFNQDGRLILLQCRPLRQVSGGGPRKRPDDAGDTIINGGVNASPGSACGPVHRVQSTTDALAMPDGAVLVLEHPLPRWAALLGRVSAVLSEEGNIAGHLATVAREMSIPALLGIGSTDALEAGRTVTVDADGLAVYEGVVSSLTDGCGSRPNQMDGSPVLTTLQKALEHISPLNLLDPDSVEFRPKNCNTLHDITRFCHEKSVHEMFNFGKDHHFPQHASKQLHYKVPMQWWVLDLDDGFRHDITGKYVRLDDIVSRPMHELWNGMVAVPWDGPPAMTGRGMASVIFHSTANPALSSPFKKPFAQRNYFMISKNFMNLQSRFGYHFSSVETLVSERDRENYVSFNFKGGAADLHRKVARVRFLAEILEENGFEVRITEDNAIARLGGCDADTISAKLRIIGYLIMHTRQLDMIMNNPKAVSHYGAKMRGEIAGL